MNAVLDRLIVVLAIAAVLSGATAFHRRYLLVPLPVPESGLEHPGLEAMRSAAAAEPDELPSQLRFLTVATGEAGAYVSFQIAYEYAAGDNIYRNILVNAPPEARLFADLETNGTFFEDRAARWRNELLRSDAVYFSDARALHTGGLSRSEDLYAVHDRVQLSRRQMRSPLIKAAKFPPAVLEAMLPVVMAESGRPGLHRAAPGLVFAQVQGEVHGAQWVFVSLRNGSELLICGEPQLTMRQIESGRSRNRLAYFGRDVSGEYAARLIRTLHDLHRQHAKLLILPAHDEDRLRELAEQGVIGEGFVHYSPFAD